MIVLQRQLGRREHLGRSPLVEELHLGDLICGPIGHAVKHVAWATVGAGSTVRGLQLYFEYIDSAIEANEYATVYRTDVDQLMQLIAFDALAVYASRELVRKLDRRLLQFTGGRRAEVEFFHDERVLRKTLVQIRRLSSLIVAEYFVDALERWVRHLEKFLVLLLSALLRARLGPLLVQPRGRLVGSALLKAF